jgi:uncharacterized protein YchJ
MNVETGQLVSFEELNKKSPEEQRKYVEVKRDLTASELANKEVAKYSPCGCGSRKKFKFCCFKKS